MQTGRFPWLSIRNMGARIVFGLLPGRMVFRAKNARSPHACLL
jgi:hypothetical protein